MSIIIISDLVLVAIAFIWIISACVTDLKKREVPNWLSFSLIAIALAIRGIIALITKQPTYFFYAVIALAIFFVVTNALYYGRVFGGGDAKLLMALAAVFATAPVFAAKNYFLISEPFLLTFTINIFVLGFIYALIFSIIAAARNRKRFSVKFKKENQKLRIIKVCCWIASIFVLIAVFFSTMLFRALLLILFIILFISPILYSFIKAVEDSALIKKVKASQLAEGDWIIDSIKIKNKIIRPSVHGLSLKDIALIKKAHKSVTIKTGLPFVPIFLAALIVSLIIGNLLTKFILLFI